MGQNFITNNFMMKNCYDENLVTKKLSDQKIFMTKNFHEKKDFMKKNFHDIKIFITKTFS